MNRKLSALSQATAEEANGATNASSRTIQP